MRASLSHKQNTASTQPVCNADVVIIKQLKEIANGQATKIWMIPAELSGAAAKIAEAFKSKG